MTATVRVGPSEAQWERSSSTQFLHPGNATLRRAIQENIVSFPAQVPVLSRRSRPDIQCRAVVLYLVRGWSMPDIAARYGLPVFRIAQVIYDWSVRAFAAGCIQVIDIDRFSALAGHRTEGKSRPVTEPTGVAGAIELVIETCAKHNGEFWSHTAAALRGLQVALEAAERLDTEAPARTLTALAARQGVA